MPGNCKRTKALILSRVQSFDNYVRPDIFLPHLSTFITVTDQKSPGACPTFPLGSGLLSTKWGYLMRWACLMEVWVWVCVREREGGRERECVFLSMTLKLPFKFNKSVPSISYLWVTFLSLNWISLVQKTCIQILSSHRHNEAWICKSFQESCARDINMVNYLQNCWCVS